MGMYDPQLVEPMRLELRDLGVVELFTSSDVDAFVSQGGVQAIFVNSVCGCAAGGARPGLAQAIASGLDPSKIATVFAGMDVEAVEQARKLWSDWPASSPQFGILCDGKALGVIQRHEIETSGATEIAQSLAGAFSSQAENTPS